MTRRSGPRTRATLAGLLLTIALALGVGGPVHAATAPSWIIRFDSIGPVSTSMTIKQAIRTLGSGASSKVKVPYCGLYGLSSKHRAGLWGYAPTASSSIAMLSVGSLFSGATKGLPKRVATVAGVHVGSTAAQLNAAYRGRLETVPVYGQTVKVLLGSRGRAMAFMLAGNRVANIAVGQEAVLTQSEYCG